MSALRHSSIMRVRKRGLPRGLYHLAAVLGSYKKMVSVKDLEPVFAEADEARRKAAEKREASRDDVAKFQLQADLAAWSTGAASQRQAGNFDSHSELDSTY